MTEKTVTITLKDEDGELAVGMRFEGTFDKDSKAHQMANILMNYMDSIAERGQIEPEETHVPVMAADVGPKLVLTA